MNQRELILALAGTALQGCLLVLLFFRKSYRLFPVFFLYVGFSVISSVVLGLLAHNRIVFPRAYWISEFLYVVLTFLVLQEAFRSVFRNFYTFLWYRLLFPVIGLLLIVLSVLKTTISPPTDHNQLTSTLISLEIAVGFLQFGIFCAFILLVSFFHMRWRQRAFGIVLGFGIAAAGSLVAFLLRSEFGTNMDKVFRIVTPLSYIIGVIVWLLTFLRGERFQLQPNWESSLSPEEMVAELRRHTKAVKGILGR
jgi:hypothetical protein